MRLADAVREQHPADALPGYLRALTPLKQQTGHPAYERKTELLLSARACHRALGAEAEFTRYLADLRADQKRKRNLMRRLDEHGLRAGARLRAGDRTRACPSAAPRAQRSRTPASSILRRTGRPGAEPIVLRPMSAARKPADSRKESDWTPILMRVKRDRRRRI
ncbi:hypothetical protein ACTPOK_14615 [Streptomyces inhibens]|uniref:hypothetical protein n=1 Tax=Streptomyces inhibens TaxID=2293571 RepID=UPI00402ACD9E